MSTKYSPGIFLVRMLSEVEAKAADFDAIYPEHLWMGLCKLNDIPNEIIPKILSNASETEISLLKDEIQELRKWFESNNIDSTLIRRSLRRKLGKGKGATKDLHRSKESYEIFDLVKNHARQNNVDSVNTLLLAKVILENPPSTLAQLMLKHTNFNPGQSFVIQKSDKDDQAKKKGFIDKLGRDLTRQASNGELNQVIGRKEEILRLAQILSQQRKGNAILVGDAGVGKTCVVEGLAQKIASPKCAPVFKGKRIIEITVSSLLSGTGHRGDLENRLETILKEAENDPNLILFIDEFHTIMGNQSSGEVIPNILKPALARGKLNLIGATTTKEYESSLAKDDAIARRFELLWIEEPSRQETTEIINGLKPNLEKHHNIKISEEAINASIDLSIRYIPDKRLPDKALDLLDQACAKKGLESLSIKTDNNGMVTMTKVYQEPSVERTDVAQVLSQRIRIPFEILSASDSDRLKILEPFLNQKVVGQKNAMETITNALKSAYSPLKDPKRPIASFLFTGPTGVGKTETAKALSEFLFKDQDHLIRIDMSEFMEKHQVARLLGAPPGYIGSDQPGLLPSALRQKPASVVLFDEIEKAHPDVLNILLQILDEGFLTDSQGRKAFFREAVIILTSNIVPQKQSNKKIGFGHAQSEDTNSDHESFVEVLRQHLKPELLGRIGHIILYDALSKDALNAIADRVYYNLRDRLNKQNINLSDELKQQIKEVIKSGKYGAREIERLVEGKIAKWVENKDISSDECYPNGDILYSIMPQKDEMEVALLVLDLVKSTQMVCNTGDTVFSNVISDIHNIFSKHQSSSSLLFLKCTGDGFLAVYQSISDALSLGISFLENNPLHDTSFRIAMNYGMVKNGPGGDPLGVEVHRVFRIEGLKNEDRIDDSEHSITLPPNNRILASHAAIDEMTESESNLFKPAGKFGLKGFDEPCEIWYAVVQETK